MKSFYRVFYYTRKLFQFQYCPWNIFILKYIIESLAVVKTNLSGADEEDCWESLRWSINHSSPLPGPGHCWGQQTIVSQQKTYRQETGERHVSSDSQSLTSCYLISCIIWSDSNKFATWKFFNLVKNYSSTISIDWNDKLSCHDWIYDDI